MTLVGGSAMRWLRRPIRQPAIAFAINGGLYGTLLTRYPEIADLVAATEAEFGAVLFAAAVGGFAGSLLAPRVIRCFGEAGATVLVGCVYAVMVLGVGLAPTVLLLGAALAAMGVADGAHDVSMNALTVRVQQRLKTSVMGRVHAIWSLSLAAAGVVGVGAAAIGLPIVLHLGLFVLVAVVAQVAAAPRRWCPAPSRAGAQRADPGINGPGSGAAGRLRSLWLVFTLLAVAAFAASYVESPGQEWTGLLLSRDFDTSPGVAAAAPVVFAGGLVLSRLFFDRFVGRLGGSALAAGSGAVIALAMLIGLVTTMVGGSVWVVLGCIGLAGFGAGPIFPLLFGAGDHLSATHGVGPATTASLVSTLSRVGAISAPVAVGLLTQAFGLSFVLLVMAVGGAAVVLTLPRAVR